MSVEVEFQQYAVGKGGFNSFIVDYKEGRTQQRYSYVYDCGGKKDLVNRELREFVAAYGPKHDLFVFSHFDQDHYSGMLLFKKHGITFDKILIPVFTIEQFLIELALSKSAMAILETLHEYRDKIIIITNDRTLEPTEAVNRERVLRGPSYEVEISTTANVFWTLKFLATRGPKMVEKKYESIRKYVEIQKIRNDLGNFDFRSLKEHVRLLKKKIRKVKSSFDFNLNSLVLASYRKVSIQLTDCPPDCLPVCPKQKPTDLHKVFGDCRESNFGFLNTGDFNLKNKTLKTELDTWLQGCLSHIGFFQLPHHGSKLSYDQGWFARHLTHCKFAMAGVQGTSKKRSGQLFPAPSVVKSLKKLNMPLAWSSSAPSSRKILKCYSNI